MAEVVILRSGQVIKGEIILQNEEVVIIRDNNGMRHQYPTNDVVAIKQEEQQNTSTEESKTHTSKKKILALSAQTTGGALYIPYLGWGGHIGADLMIGANIWNKKLFLAGVIGYRGKMVNDVIYSFIPLQVCMSSILGDKQNAPIVGMNLGYGFATNTGTQSGICVGADVGWGFEISHETRLVVGLNAEWQQAKTKVYQEIIFPETNESKLYENYMGVNFIALGAKVSIHF
jgi:hypothetical protein